MKLKTAYETAVAEHPEGAEDLLQFVSRYADRRSVLTNYHCVGTAAAVIVSFLNAAGMAGAFSVEKSALEPEAARIRWTDRNAAQAMANDISGAISSCDSVVFCTEWSPFVADTSVEVHVETGTRVTESLEGPDMVAAAEAVMSELTANPAWDPRPTVSLRDSKHSQVTVTLSRAESVMLGRAGDSSKRIFACTAADYGACRYIRDDEELVPVAGFLEAPFERTVGADCDDGDDVFSNYIVYTVEDAETAPRTGRHSAVLFLSTNVATDVDALQFLSDRTRFLNYVRDCCEAAYGCGGKFRCIVDPRSRVTVDNDVVSGMASACHFDDDCLATNRDRPVRVQAVVYVVPAGLVSDGNRFRTPSMELLPEPVKVVESQDMVADAMRAANEERFVTVSEKAAEWFAMTHCDGFNGNYRRLNYDEDRVSSATAKLKARYAKLQADPEFSVRMCSMTSPWFRMSPSNDNGSPLPIGSPAAAFAMGVGGLVRRAWYLNIGKDSDSSCVFREGPDPYSLHDRGYLVTAVYSGVSTGHSPTVDEWLADRTKGFPKLVDTASCAVFGSSVESWTKFVDALPESGAMFLSPAKADTGDRFTYNVVVETNVPYVEFANALSAGTKVDTLAFSESVRRLAVSALAFRGSDPAAGLDNDGHLSCPCSYAVDRALRHESDEKTSVDAMIGSNVAVYDNWNGQTVVTIRPDAFGRMYVVVGMSGSGMLYGRVAFRFTNGARLQSAEYATRLFAGNDTPRGYAVVPGGERQSVTRVRAYALAMLQSDVGEYGNPPYNAWRYPRDTDSPFWTTAYRGPFTQARNMDPYDTKCPPRQWFLDTCSLRGVRRLQDYLV